MVHGKEGPFAHIAALVANALLRLPVFARIVSSHVLKQQMLTAACTAGIAANFGSVFGAVLFSVEVTSALYDVSNYWDSFATAVPSALVSRILTNLINGEPSLLRSLVPFTGNQAGLDAMQLALSFAMGGAFGLLSAAFVWMNGGLVLAIRKIQPTSRRAQMYVFLFVCVRLMCGLILFIVVSCAFRSLWLAPHHSHAPVPVLGWPIHVSVIPFVTYMSFTPYM